MIHERETEFRCRKFVQIRGAMEAAVSAGQPDDAPAQHPTDLEAVSNGFRSVHDPEPFRRTMDSFSRRSSFSEDLPGFNFGVAIFLNSLAKKVSEPSELAGLLVEIVELPATDRQVEDKVAKPLTQVELLREGGHPVPKASQTPVHSFGGSRHLRVWPFLGPASEDAVERLGWLPKDHEPVERHREYRQVIRSLADAVTLELPPVAARLQPRRGIRGSRTWRLGSPSELCSSVRFGEMSDSNFKLMMTAAPDLDARR